MKFVARADFKCREILIFPDHNPWIMIIWLCASDEITSCICDRFFKLPVLNDHGKFCLCFLYSIFFFLPAWYFSIKLIYQKYLNFSLHMSMSTITQVYVLKSMHVGLILQVFKYLLVLVCCVYASYGRLSELFLDKEWEEFKQIHNKVYSKQEENRRWDEPSKHT